MPSGPVRTKGGREGTQLGYGHAHDRYRGVGARCRDARLAGIKTGRPALLGSGAVTCSSCCSASVGAFAVMEWALFSPRLLARVRRRQPRARHPGALHVHRRVGRARRLDPAVGAAAVGLRRLHHVAVPRTAPTTRSCAWATLVQYSSCCCSSSLLMLFPANPFKVHPRHDPARRAGPEPATAESTRSSRSTRRSSTRVTSGFTIPFSFAIAALITGRFGEGWLADVRRTTLVACGFLTVGIMLGAFWSYSVLGWGGYWGWDPVENASLLPWLTATAFIHSVMVQERRGMLRVWNLSLVIATFCLTILGTFLTRSGVLNSVHAFSTSSIGPWLFDVPRHRARALGVGLDRVARRPAPIAGPHRLRRSRAKPRSCSTTCCSPASRSSCSPARCSRCSCRRCRTSRSPWASPTSTSSACRSASRCCS